MDANTPDTFKALEQGNLGAFLGGQPYYYFAPAMPTAKPYFNITNTTTLPSIVILYGHRAYLDSPVGAMFANVSTEGFDASLMYAAVANGAKYVSLDTKRNKTYAVC